MFENGKKNFVWMALLPSGFYAFATVTYILNAKIGFHLPWSVAYAGGAAFCVFYVAVILWYGGRRAARLRK